MTMNDFLIGLLITTVLVALILPFIPDEKRRRDEEG